MGLLENIAAMLSIDAYLDFLLQMGFAGTDHAEARLLLQTALTVVISHTSGDAKTACL